MPGGGRGGSAGGADDQLSPGTLNIIIPVIIISVGVVLSIIMIIAIRRIRKRHPGMKAYGDQVL